MSTLTDRYIAEVVRHLPEAQREDIAAEIAGTVEDMVAAERDAGVGGGGRGKKYDDDAATTADADEAERVVLARLGDPVALARRYSDARQYLIGPGAYPVWVRVLRWLLPIVGVLAALANGIVYVATTPQPELGAMIGEAVPGAITALLWVFAAWTLLVAVIERATPPGIRSVFEQVPDWDPASLETGPARSETRFDAVASLIVLAVLAGLPFLPSTFLYIGHLNGGGPLINPAIHTSWIVGYLVLIAALALVQVWLLLRPGFQRGRLAVEVVTDVAFGLFLTALVLSQDQVLHPGLVDADANAVSATVRWGIIVAIWAVVVWDQMETVRAYRRAERRVTAG